MNHTRAHRYPRSAPDVNPQVREPAVSPSYTVATAIVAIERGEDVSHVVAGLDGHEFVEAVVAYELRGNVLETLREIADRRRGYRSQAA